MYLDKAIIDFFFLAYWKFGYTYDKFSVCELDYDQKISVCEAIFSSEMFEFKMDLIENNHPKLSCERRLVDLSGGSQVTDKKELLLSMYECPNPYKLESRYYNGKKEAVMFSIPAHFFIIGGYFRNSVVLGYQHAGIPRPVKFRTVFLDVPLEQLQLLRFMKRNKNYEKRTEERKFTQIIVERETSRGESVDRFQLLADNEVLYNNEIRKMSGKYSLTDQPPSLSHVYRYKLELTKFSDQNSGILNVSILMITAVKSKIFSELST